MHGYIDSAVNAHSVLCMPVTYTFGWPFNEINQNGTLGRVLKLYLVYNRIVYTALSTVSSLNRGYLHTRLYVAHHKLALSFAP